MLLNLDVFFPLVFVSSQPTNGGPKRVLFRTQPDVLYLTLQDGRAATTLSPPDGNEEDKYEDLSAANRQQDSRTCLRYKRGPR